MHYFLLKLISKVAKWDKGSNWINDMKEQHMPKFRTPSRSSSTTDREAANNLQNKNRPNGSTNSSGKYNRIDVFFIYFLMFISFSFMLKGTTRALVFLQ